MSPSNPAPRQVRLFRNNRNQAIRIPVEFELPGNEAIISRDLSFSVPADSAYGDIRAEPETAGRPIGSNDLLIGAHAQALGATLVTVNVGEFRRIRGLNVESWSASEPA